jgi:two-component sensor histidine kinase
MSLSRAQDLLTGKTGAAAELRSIIATAIEAHAPGTGRVTLDGPRISVLPRPALALALALHEMATNATKYGALSTPAGRVDIRWHVGAFDAGSILQLSWCEIGGPAVQAPTRKGCGSRLIESVITGDFGGSAIPSYDANGVNWAISAPLAAIT